jgi:CRISPR/Cas system Type II protein with McrA/HNH and RuvC-like nuclease domain
MHYGKPSPLAILLQSETIARDTDQIRKFWCNQIELGQSVYCTWSGKQIKKTDDLAIDHAIPFSVLFNNDFWNLLPAKNAVNANKTDKILSKTQLLASKSRILTAWKQYLQTPELADTFAAQCQISLTKAPIFTPEDLLEKFQDINVGFVELRGMESWGWG